MKVEFVEKARVRTSAWNKAKLRDRVSARTDDVCKKDAQVVRGQVPRHVDAEMDVIQRSARSGSAGRRKRVLEKAVSRGGSLGMETAHHAGGLHHDGVGSGRKQW